MEVELGQNLSLTCHGPKRQQSFCLKYSEVAVEKPEPEPEPAREAQEERQLVVTVGRKASWIELNLRAGEDRMKIGVAMEKEARELEAAGQAEEALEGFHRAIAVQKLVYNFDDRCKNNAQIKELVGKKIASLEDDVKRLSPSEEQATPIDDLEARLRKLRE
eukprot:s105_g4.t1